MRLQFNCQLIILWHQRLCTDSVLLGDNQISDRFGKISFAYDVNVADKLLNNIKARSWNRNSKRKYKCNIANSCEKEKLHVDNVIKDQFF